MERSMQLKTQLMQFRLAGIRTLHSSISGASLCTIELVAIYPGNRSIHQFKKYKIIVSIFIMSYNRKKIFVSSLIK